MSLRIFELLELLENDLAALYEHLKPKAVSDTVKEVFDFMDKHSRGHAKKIGRLRERYEKQPFNEESILALHKRVKIELYKKLTEERPETEVCELLEQTEETLAKLYQSLALYYENMSAHYATMAQEIAVLSKEELRHRDIVKSRRVAPGPKLIRVSE